MTNETNITPEALLDLIGELGREVFHLIDGCETSGEKGEEVHTIDGNNLERVSAVLDRIEALPFEEPGVILGPGAMLQVAIQRTFALPDRMVKPASLYDEMDYLPLQKAP